jgi:hypothetical protein
MKKFLLLGVVSFLLSTSVFARETNSMRSSTELVTVGDSEESLLQNRTYALLFIDSLW